MEKDFVTYNEALALKELGFDEPCFCIYNREKVLRFNNLNNPNDRNKGVKLTSNNGRYPAPTYQQAFRWFREKHGYFSSPMQSTKPSGIEYDWLITKDIDESRIFVKTVGYFTTYEEAELECVKKLIKIVNEIEK